MIWKVTAERQLAEDVLGAESITACEAAFAEGYETCALRLAGCTTLVLKAEELVIAIDAAVCNEQLAAPAFLAVDADGELPPRRVE
ncbi:MAG: hypothetical protein GY913_05815 [Proteobacteria bacterium]|nr:hypothetical protein [Pseudomonadota bacterium]MCP4916421.1 hypothetical protein [Pseudomonadota bacterium]